MSTHFVTTSSYFPSLTGLPLGPKSSFSSPPCSSSALTPLLLLLPDLKMDSFFSNYFLIFISMGNTLLFLGLFLAVFPSFPIPPFANRYLSLRPRMVDSGRSIPSVLKKIIISTKTLEFFHIFSGKMDLLCKVLLRPLYSVLRGPPSHPPPQLWVVGGVAASA